MRGRALNKPASLKILFRVPYEETNRSPARALVSSLVAAPLTRCRRRSRRLLACLLALQAWVVSIAGRDWGWAWARSTPLAALSRSARVYLHFVS
jgi:hypothetical protein